MNPIRLAIQIILLLGAFFGASAGNQPTREELVKYGNKIKSQLVLPKGESKKELNRKVSFYFSVNEKGEVESVNAICSDKDLKTMLEKGFSRINLNGFPVHKLSRIDLHYIVY